MADYKDELNAALAEARQRRSGTLHDICRSRGMEIKADGGSCYAKPCPFCGKKDTFKIFENAGRTSFKCHNNTCRGNEGGDEIGFLIMADGMSRREAIRAFLAGANVEHPWDRFHREREQRRQEAEKTPVPRKRSEAKAGKAEHSAPADEPAEPEDDVPGDLIAIPEIDRNVYEAAWLALDLTSQHRKELQTKRGMSDGWIDALGMRSAVKENLERLAPLLEQFPPNVLLRAGIASRGRDQSLRVARVLAGYRWDEDQLREEYSPTLIIPYVDEAGRIVLLRPHKRSLSNKRWRDREEVSGHYEKLWNNLRIPYGEHLLRDRPQAWKHTCVLCEGELKATALRMCGIPAMGFQGIHFFRQNHEHKQAIEDTADRLRRLEIREVIVVFDNEGKEHKDFHERFEAEIHARYTAECMEDKGFKALYGMLPDNWREGGENGPDGVMIGGKADWDSRLAWHVRRCKSIPRGRAAAAEEFAAFLSDRDGHRSAVQEPPRQVQMEFLSPKEDVINQALHRLRHTPEIFTGGKWERETANELENWCHEDFRHLLRVEQLAEDLRATSGGYYKIKKPTEQMEVRCIDANKKLKELIADAEEEGDETLMRQLRAAKTAVWIILRRYPKPFTDFTARSQYKVMVEEEGRQRVDRLIVFTDKNGVKSKSYQMPAAQMGSSQELRKFFLSQGGFHWWGNQEECDMWVRDLDVHNYQKTIEEIATYGWQKEQKFYLLGDCAVADGHFIFPDRNGIIWFKGSGYKMSYTTAAFTSIPPMLFPGEKNPKAAAAAIDWEAERVEVAKIWSDALDDFRESFGGYGGYAVIAGLIQHLAHAEVLPMIGGKPGLWVNGEKGSGKTKSIEFAMRLLGFPRNYGFFSLGSTKVSIERTLSQFCNLPSHIDEWRNENADPKTEDLLRNCYNEVATIKGTPNGGKGVRKSVPLNIPVVTGEDATTDTALRSRYVRITASKSFGQIPQEGESPEEEKERAKRDTAARDARYFRIMERSEQYYRVGRYLFKHREQFAAMVVENCKTFTEKKNVTERMPDARARQVFGVFFGALVAAQQLFLGQELFGTNGPQIAGWFINHGAESSEDTERDVFRKRFFAECVTMMDRGVDGIKEYIRVFPGHRDATTGRVQLYHIHPDSNAARLYVLVAARELFDEYKADKRKRGENAPLARDNIMAELRAQACWVKAPTGAVRQHKYSIPGEKASTRTWWVLDYKLCDPDLRDIFKNVWEREVDKADFALDEDERSIISRTGQALFST